MKIKNMDELILKKAGLVNSILSPIRTKNIIDPVALEAQLADREYIKGVKADILNKSRRLEDYDFGRGTTSVTLEEIKNGLDGKLSVSDPVFSQLMRNRYVGAKTAKSNSVILKEAGFINDIKPVVVNENRTPYPEFLMDSFKRESQDNFLEASRNAEEERIMNKIRSSKDKLEALQHITLENPNMSRAQYQAVLSSLM